MMEEDDWIEALRKDPADHQLRLVYADWLEERGHPGADYLRAEGALSRAAGDEANGLRRKLLEVIPRLPTRWRDDFEQPDLLLAPPVPFAMGWYSANAKAPRPYRSLPNLDLDLLSPDMPWLSGEGTRDRVDQAAHEREELAALAEVQERAAELNLVLPPGFVSFARDFRRRGAVSPANSYFEVCLHDAVVGDFPRVGDGYLVLFFADMNYGNPHQVAWSLYLVPGIAWHCVVVFELADDAGNLLPDDPAVIFYCAPSFQAFLYRWWLGSGGGRAQDPRARG
jgi:uncharacterized protein (TIGR02996 family)